MADAEDIAELAAANGAFASDLFISAEVVDKLDVTPGVSVTSDMAILATFAV